MRKTFVKHILKVIGLLGFVVSTQTAMSCTYGCGSADCDDESYMNSSSDGSLGQNSSSAPAQTNPLNTSKIQR